MVKPIISVAVTFMIFLGGAIYEQTYVKKAFKSLESEFTEIYENLENETAKEEDLLSAQNSWLNEKRKLHAFIPHNEIKELDLWISEAVYYVKSKNFEEALGKVSVTIELLQQIPKTFKVSFENLF